MILQNIVTSKTVYRFFARPFIRDGILKTRHGFIDLSGQHAFIQSLIFWNVYERKEISAIRKYFNKSLDVIELGSSIGLVSMCVGNILKDCKNKFISVEANPLLMDNLRHSAKLNQYSIIFINAAICYSADEVRLEIDDKNLGSKISGINDEKGVLVKSTTLGKLFHENNIGSYTLICDIEGAESHIFTDENDPIAISSCRQIIIELHDTVYKNVEYSQKALADMIMKKFFMNIIFSFNNIWIFEKELKS